MRTVVLATLTFSRSPILTVTRRLATCREGRNMDSLRGKTLRWTFTEGPVAGTLFEHTFQDDGSVVWRVLEGQGKGHGAGETIRHDAGE